MNCSGGTQQCRDGPVVRSACSIRVSADSPCCARCCSTCRTKTSSTSATRRDCLTARRARVRSVSILYRRPRLLQQHGVKCLVVACNTASAVALDALTQEFAPVPVLGVLEPGAAAACRATRDGRIAVIATESTVRGGAYQAAIARRLPNATVVARAHVRSSWRSRRRVGPTAPSSRVSCIVISTTCSSRGRSRRTPIRWCSAARIFPCSRRPFAACSGRTVSDRRFGGDHRGRARRRCWPRNGLAATRKRCRHRAAAGDGRSGALCARRAPCFSGARWRPDDVEIVDLPVATVPA